MICGIWGFAMVIPDWVKSSIPAAVVALGFISYEWFGRKGEVAPTPAITTVAKQYKSDLSPRYHTAAEKVRSHVFEDKQAIGQYIQAGSKPLATAMDTAVAPFMSSENKIENADAVADILDSISQGMK